MFKNGLVAVTMLAGVVWMSGGRVLAQDLAAQTVQGEEAQQFWPIYDRYTAELAR